MRTLGVLALAASMMTAECSRIPNNSSETRLVGERYADAIGPLYVYCDTLYGNVIYKTPDGIAVVPGGCEKRPAEAQGGSR